MADVSRTVDIIFKGKDQVSGPVADIEQSIGAVGDEADSAAGSVGDLNTGFAGLGGAPLQAVKLLGAALAALGVKLIVDEFIDANSAIESFRRSLEFSTGSAELAEEELNFVRSAAENLGLELLSTADAYSKYSAATSRSALTADESRSIFLAVAGSISATGGSAEDVSGSLVQLQQGISKTKFELDDLKILAERIPGFFDTFTKALNTNEQAFFKLVSAGKIGNEEITKLAALLQEDLEGTTFDSLINETNRFKTAITELNVVLGDAGLFELVKDGVEIATTGIESLTDGITTVKDEYGITFETIKRLPFGPLIEGALKILNIATDDTTENLEKLVDELEAVPFPLQEIEVSARRIAVLKPYDDLIESTEQVTEKTSKAVFELEKLASNERIKNIEARVQLDIANLEADAKVAVAIIEGLSTSIEATAQLIGDLFGSLIGADNLRQEFAIEKQIDLENDRRQQQLDQQEQLNNAQIRKLNAETKALRDGDPVITVNGDGLQPHLEAFMFEILESIQVRVNADGLQQLLGVA